MTDLAIEQAKQLAELLIKANAKLVTAESCTGGGLAEILTRLPGSSAWFERGYVSYANDAKIELLNVNSKTLALYGAVSEEIAREMVVGAVKNSHANIGVSVTGVAGPGGGTVEKPVGTVCFGWNVRETIIKTKRVVFNGDRLAIREQSCLLALQGLIDEMQAYT